MSPKAPTKDLAERFPKRCQPYPWCAPPPLLQAEIAYRIGAAGASTVLGALLGFFDAKTFVPDVGARLHPNPTRHPTTRVAAQSSTKNPGQRPQDKYPLTTPKNAPKLAEYGPETPHLP